MNLKPIQNDEELKAALKEIDALWNAEDGTPEADHLEALAILVERYEQEQIGPELKFNPVAHDHEAFLERAAKRPGFREAYDNPRPEVEQAWLHLAEQRAQEIRAGTVETFAAEDVIEQARNSVRGSTTD